MLLCVVSRNEVARIKRHIIKNRSKSIYNNCKCKRNMGKRVLKKKNKNTKLLLIRLKIKNYFNKF